MTSFVITPANQNEFLFLKEMFDRLKIQYKPFEYDVDIDNEEQDWKRFSMIHISGAYSDDEPEYSSLMIKEPNPEYNPKILS